MCPPCDECMRPATAWRDLARGVFRHSGGLIQVPHCPRSTAPPGRPCRRRRASRARSRDAK
eukprot:862361-Pleurochrysis_carterae.AAC.1